MARRLRKASTGGIDKSEDRAWREWYNNLGVKEHEQYLAKLGLDKEEIEGREEAEGIKKPTGKKRSK